MTVWQSAARLSINSSLTARVPVKRLASAVLHIGSQLTANVRAQYSVGLTIDLYTSLSARAATLQFAAAELHPDFNISARHNLQFVGAVFKIETTFSAVQGTHGQAIPSAPYAPPLAPVLPSRRRQLLELGKLLDRMTKVLLSASSGAPGRKTAPLRRAVGDLLAHYETYVFENRLGAALLKCFAAATTAGITVDGLDRVLKQLFAETPNDGVPMAFVQTAVVLALAQDSRVLSTMSFVSREDVDAMQLRMRKWFDLAKDMSADETDSAIYAALVDLAAWVTRFLADTGRPLPRIVEVTLELPLPALTVSNRIYGSGARWEEIVAENKIVHPLFCPRELRVLSE